MLQWFKWNGEFCFLKKKKKVYETDLQTDAKSD